jgi:hypothetical protein
MGFYHDFKLQEDVYAEEPAEDDELFFGLDDEDIRALPNRAARAEPGPA